MITVGITAAGSGIGEAVIRALNYADLDVYTIGMDMQAFKSGMFWTNNAFIIPPVAEEETYIQSLLQLCKTQGITVLIPGTDIELVPLSKHITDFEKINCTIIVGSTKAVSLSFDKKMLYEFSAEKGLPFVKTMTLPDAQKNINEFTFPVIAKPKSGSASVGAHLVCTSEQLLTHSNDGDYIVQEYLHHDISKKPCLKSLNTNTTRLLQINEISAQFYINRDGEILGHFVSVNKLKDGVPIEVIPDMGSPAIRDGLPLVKALADEGLVGPVNLQGRLTEDGVKFFEVNARFTGITGVRAAMGYREVEAAIRDLALKQSCEQVTKCLQTTPGFIGTRQVDEIIVPKSRVEQLINRKVIAPETLIKNNHKILITGATGYLGANLMAHLQKKHDIIAAVRNSEASDKLNKVMNKTGNGFVFGELPHTVWPLEGVDTVIHTAALRPLFKGDDNDFFRVNVEGTRRLLENAAQSGVKKFIFLSTQGIYGCEYPILWQEHLKPKPGDMYSVSKYYGELLCRNTLKHDMQIIILRVARVYGHGYFMRDFELPHTFAKKAVMRENLSVSGDGATKLDLLHIKDFVKAVESVLASHLPLHHTTVVNIGSGSPVSVMELATITKDSALNLNMANISIEHTDQKDHRQFGMDIRKARTLLGWHPETSYEAGMTELIQNALNN